MRKTKGCPACGCKYGISQITALRSQVAELQKDVQVAKEQYQGACDDIKNLERNENLARNTIREQTDRNIELTKRVAGLQAELNEHGKREPDAWLINYYEETKSGGKRNCIQASLEPNAPTIMPQQESNIAERRLIKAEPLYRLPPNTEAMIERAREEEREECAKVCESETTLTCGDCADAIRARKP